MEQTPELPPKQEVALALLQTAMSVYVHLDPRGEEVHVPAWFKKQPQLVLQIGLNMAVSIPDLDIGEEALSCTLSFNRRPEFCYIPWDAIYGLVGEDGRGMIWPDSVPPEVAAEGQKRVPPAEKRPSLRVVSSEEDETEPAREEQEPVAQEEAESQGASARPASVRPALALAQEEAPAAEEQLSEAPPTEDSPATPALSEKQKGAPSSGKKRELPSYLRVVK